MKIDRKIFLELNKLVRGLTVLSVDFTQFISNYDLESHIEPASFGIGDVVRLSDGQERQIFNIRTEGQECMCGCIHTGIDGEYNYPNADITLSASQLQPY